MSDGELKKRLIEAIDKSSEWDAGDRILTITITPILDEAKADFPFIGAVYFNKTLTKEEVELLSSAMNKIDNDAREWFEKWFGTA